MDRLSASRADAAASQAIENAGASRAEIAEAIGLTSYEMGARLSGAVEFSVSELVATGGLLRVRASSFLGATP